MTREELQELYGKCGAAVERRCRALLGEEEEVRDMVQEVFLRAVVHSAEFRGEAAPLTWLYRISTNLCLNRLRDAKKHLPIELFAAVLPARAATPEGVAMARQFAAALLAGLDARTQAAIVYRYLDGMTQEEIAAVTGWSRKTLGRKLREFELRAESLKEKAS